MFKCLLTGFSPMCVFIGSRSVANDAGEYYKAVVRPSDPHGVRWGGGWRASANGKAFFRFFCFSCFFAAISPFRFCRADGYTPARRLVSKAARHFLWL